MEIYNFKDIDFLVCADKLKIVPFTKDNKNKTIKLILDDNKVIRNTKKAISAYLDSTYKVVDGFIIAGIIAKFQTKVLYDYSMNEKNVPDKMVVETQRQKQIEIYRSTIDSETLEKYINGLKKFIKARQKEEQKKELEIENI